MRKLSLLAVALLALPAVTATAAPGVNLRWTTCLSDGGALNRSSTCASNLGLNSLTGSFELPGTILSVTGIQAAVDLAAADATLPAWWRFNASGGVTGCRGSALITNTTLPANAVNCVDWAQGSATGGLAGYDVGYYGPNTARISLAYAIPSPGLDAQGNVENFAFNIVFNNSKTVGLDACAGCLTPVCLILKQIYLLQGRNLLATLSGPTNGTDSFFATWQGGGVPFTRNGTGCPAATPARNATWGSLKALYR